MNAIYDFSDQCGIVTGAASGIGKALALLLTESNADLVLVDRDKIGLEATVRACKEIRADALLAVDADVSKEQDVNRMVEETLVRFGTIHFLVTCAGILFRNNFTDISLPEWDEIMNTNVRGLFYVQSIRGSRNAQTGKRHHRQRGQCGRALHQPDRRGALLCFQTRGDRHHPPYGPGVVYKRHTCQCVLPRRHQHAHDPR